MVMFGEANTATVNDSVQSDRHQNRDALSKVIDSEYASRRSHAIVALLINGAIVADETQASHYRVDISKARDILLRVAEKHPETQDRPLTPELSIEEIRSAYGTMIKSLVDTSIFDSRTVGQIARITNSSDISVEEGNFAQFVFLHDVFPVEKQDRGELIVGNAIVANYMNRLERIATKTGIAMDTEQIRALALQLILGHEYGHATHATKLVIKTEAALIDHDKAELSQIALREYTAFNQNVTRNLAPNDELNSLFPNTAEQTLSERIATGVQDIVVKQALRASNIPETQVEAFVSNFHEEEQLTFLK